MATKDAAQNDGNAIKETISVIIQALLLALVLRTFLFQPFSIPSGSMKPTLLVGDYIFVSKWSYGYSRHSFPFSPPIFDGRIWAEAPERGDIVVFKYPPDTSKDYIKRVVGLPGDRVQLRDSVLYVNDVAVERFEQGTFTEETSRGTISLPIFRERLESGESYETIDIQPGSPGDTTPVFEVPEGNFFFVGDNRDNSADSRYDVGMVPFENLVGKAQIIFLSLEGNAGAWQIWRWPTDMRWGRLFKSL